MCLSVIIKTEFKLYKPWILELIWQPGILKTISLCLIHLQEPEEIICSNGKIRLLSTVLPSLFSPCSYYFHPWIIITQHQGKVLLISTCRLSHIKWDSDSSSWFLRSCLASIQFFCPAVQHMPCCQASYLVVVNSPSTRASSFPSWVLHSCVSSALPGLFLLFTGLSSNLEGRLPCLLF